MYSTLSRATQKAGVASRLVNLVPSLRRDDERRTVLSDSRWVARPTTIFSPASDALRMITGYLGKRRFSLNP